MTEPIFFILLIGLLLWNFGLEFRVGRIEVQLEPDSPEEKAAWKEQMVRKE